MIKPRFTGLKNLVVKMGADLIPWQSDGITRTKAEFIKNLTTTGIEVKYEDIVIRDDGLLEANGEQIVIYIKDHGGGVWNGVKSFFGSSSSSPNLDPESLRRFHLSDCSTIEGMKNANRYDRYVATARKDGLFEIDLRGQEMEAKLYPCINCMKRLQYKNYQNIGYDKQREIRQNFDMEEFFNLYQARFKSKPKYTNKTAPKNEYPDNWKEISEKYRESKNWVCEKCGKDLSNNRGYLHAHHINGIKSDCLPSNLKALCKICHSQEPHHGHMR